MVNESLLKQLENSLILYQENQGTLNAVVQNAQSAFGEDWMNELPLAFDNVQMDASTKALLKDKANHAVHYYGALAAWQEASTYLNDSSTLSSEALAERIPVLEYWLALFGNEGAGLVEQVKNLYSQLLQKEETGLNTQATQEVPLTQEQPTEVEQVATQEQVTSPEIKTGLVDEDEILAEPIAQQADVTENIVEEEVIPQAEPVETQTTTVEEVVETEAQTQPEEAPEQIIETRTDVVAQTTESEQSEVVIEEATQEVPPETQEVQFIGEETQATEQTTLEAMQIAQAEQPSVIDDVQEIWKTDETTAEETIDKWFDASSAPAPTVQQEVVTETRSQTQNWDIANFLRQKRLYDDANNWLSAWCIRMDNAEKTDYPHYGFIVDIMHDLKEKIQNVLENQLLEELVEREIEGGRVGMERLAKAIDEEIENLPDDFKISTSEKIKLSAREILGEMDTSNQKEFIGPAPDGFELMDDPYEASTEQIINDFEKTEKEAKNQIDKLNVMEDNKSN